MSLNPYASGEAALPATEVVPRAPKVAFVSAALGCLSVVLLVGAVAYVSWASMGREPSPQELTGSAISAAASGLLACIGLLLGIVALFLRRRPRTVAVVATFTNGAILLCIVAIMVFGYNQSTHIS